jgi:hypothetical protein
MGPDRSVSRAAAALFALGALLSPELGRAETPEVEISKLQSELAATKSELAETKNLLSALAQRVDQLSRGDGAAPAEATPGQATARIAPVNADNPAISFVVDGKGIANTTGADGVGYALGTAELFIAAPIDPFLRGYASINGTTDQGFDVEEAALVTTALPYNLTVKGGRFFADFGRFPHWHNEALPFVDRPPSIERIIGGESQAEGVETSWLAPTDQFIQLTFGSYNGLGDQQTVMAQRSWSALTYLVRPQTYFDLSETVSLDLGGSFASVPTDSKRALYGVDVTLRHQPGTSELYQGTVVGAEWLWNNERFAGLAPGETARFTRQGGYAYFESFFARQFSAGARADYAENPFGEVDRQRTYSGFLTWSPSEFQRLRFQFDQIALDGPNDQRFTLQWTAFLGSHSHGFAAR